MRWRNHNIAKQFHAYCLPYCQNRQPGHQKGKIFFNSPSLSKETTLNPEQKVIQKDRGKIPEDVLCNHGGLCRLRTCSLCCSGIQRTESSRTALHHLQRITWWLSQATGNRASSESRVALTGSVPMGCALHEQHWIQLMAVKKDTVFICCGANSAMQIFMYWAKNWAAACWVSEALVCLSHCPTLLAAGLAHRFRTGTGYAVLQGWKTSL